MSNYATIDDVKEYRPPGSTGALDFTNWSDAQIQDALDLAEEWINTLVNDRFDQWNDTYHINGSGTRKQFLFPSGLVHKIHSLTEVVEVDFDRTSILTTYTEGYDYNLDSYYLYKNDARPLRVRSYVGSAGGVWPQGTGNIRITGTFGWESIPNAIKQASILLTIVNTLGPESAGYSSTGGSTGGNAVQESWPDYTVTNARDNSVETENKIKGVTTLTGYTEIDRLLNPYINYVDMMIAVP